METNVDYLGADILNKSGIKTQYVCAELCALTDGGLFWTYAVEDKKCYVKGSASGRTNREGHISGNTDCVRGEMRKLKASHTAKLEVPLILIQGGFFDWSAQFSVPK